MNLNQYVRKLFGVMFQSRQTQQVIRVLPRHSPTSLKEWCQYWQAKGFPWRTEPEIDEKRQEELSKCRTIVPDIEKGIYPFKGMKLSRADVEWLLATHEGGKGPIDWKDQNQRKREGLDLRGADLREVNLSRLPLARLRGGTSLFVRVSSKAHQDASVVTMEYVDLSEAQLQGANLEAALLQHAEFYGADLEEANLSEAQLEGASFHRAFLEHVNFTYAKLENADLSEALLYSANLSMAHLKEVSLRGAVLENVSLREAQLENVDLKGVDLANDKHVGPYIADAIWEGINLTVVEWSQVKILGDEYVARQSQDRGGRKKDKETRLDEYEAAVRANRQLAVVLEDQGLNEDAARFAYRAQVLQRHALWRQRNFWKWLGSAILALLAGYGYRMWRILAAYLLVVLLCTVAYFVLGMYYEPHLSFLEALLTSITAFHGRVFSEPFLRPGEPQLWVTAFEAVAGLVIEGVFIAMLAQKFFGK